ncbi:MAG TPA: type II toxin-antitoxin system VapC family toxin [bacterium]|nr:type II toxin-antitoxin system VapC family toxin [bacterium]
MSVIDTSIVIEKVKKNEDIKENVTEITIVEYPPIMDYEKFYGKVLIIRRDDVLLSIELQKRLRMVGKPKSFSDLVIASICINRNEELITKDEDFLDIAEISNLRVKMI